MIYFFPGDVVTLRQDIPNKPTMIVVKKDTYMFRPKENEEKNEFLRGFICRWFTDTGQIQEATFNTKDLVKLNNGKEN